MDIYILNKKFEIVSIIDKFESFIWTDRYSESGEFELVTKNIDEYFNLLVPGNYVTIPESEHIMAITIAKLEDEFDEGDSLTVSGISLEEYILNHRIVWTQTNVYGNPSACVKKLLDENIINPSDSKRKLNSFSYKNTSDSRITDIRIESQYTGDGLYNAISDICITAKIGMKLTLDTTKTSMIFSLYHGEDLSFSQMSNAFVLFSPSLENILDSNYVIDMSKYGNVALTAGEGEGTDRKTVVVGDSSLVGLNRREMFVDARDISSNGPNNIKIPPDKYMKKLESRGKLKLIEAQTIEAFDGEISDNSIYKYGIDYNIGDIIQIENAYGKSLSVRISEYIWSVDGSGVKEYPTLIKI